MGAAMAPYVAKTDKERLATGFWNRIESNQATDCNISFAVHKTISREIIPLSGLLQFPSTQERILRSG